MKLLIITQVVDVHDPVLGFFCEWIHAFSRQCEHVTVICLKKGEYTAPQNVKVLSLGKEEGVSRSKYLKRFYQYTWNERKHYDSVFIHMNQIYALLGALCWKLMKKRVGLWYAHGKVPFSLRIANLCIDIAFASTLQGYGIATRKLAIVGQGIDTDMFTPQQTYKKYSLLTIGRISPVKRIELCIDAFALIAKDYPDATFTIIGSAGLDEHVTYEQSLKNKVQTYGLQDRVIFNGPIDHADLPARVADAHVFVNMSNTASLDKALLEAMSAGVPVISSNASFKVIVKNEKYHADSAEKLAERIRALFALEHRPSLREVVVQDHSLVSLINKIITKL